MRFYLSHTQARNRLYSPVEVVSPRNATGHPQLARVLRPAGVTQARMAETHSEFILQALLNLMRVKLTRFNRLRRPC